MSAVPPKQWDNVVPHVSSMEQYKETYEKSIQDPTSYWGDVAKEALHWERPFDCVLNGSFERGNIRWFEGGKLNVSYNCLDRHLKERANHTAFIWESDEPGQHREISFQEATDEVCRFANVLIQHGVKKGDRVAIYMPMVPEATYAMLACCRIGAIHSAVFAGFSAEALRSRILDADCRVVLTADVGARGGRTIPLKRTVDEALRGCPNVSSVIVYKHVHKNAEVTMEEGRDFWLHEEMEKQRPYCPPVSMDAEDPMFMLYTSGSTGKPKGLVHTTGGYAVYTAHTTKIVWDLHPNDRFACVADVGWITGHTYVVYGPLLNGVTSLLFESVPTYPDPSRYWKLIDEHKITQFYTAPTAIRTLMSFGNTPLDDTQRTSLRVLGSVGEPINPEAWRWYHNIVGKERCAIVDSWFQTETSAICICPLPGVTPMKPGSATLPFFGQRPVLLDSSTAEVIEGTGEGLLMLANPWPGIARTIYNGHDRYLKTYLQDYPGYYFTGDGAKRDDDGYIWITGRVDDVINKCGHRLGTAEIESAMVLHASCSEAAVVAIPDDIKGQAIVAFAVLNSGEHESDELAQALKLQVRQQIGGLAVPDFLIIVPGLPKTRSGKIMRRILRKLAENQFDQLGDTSTMADVDILEIVMEKTRSIMGGKA